MQPERRAHALDVWRAAQVVDRGLKRSQAGPRRRAEWGGLARVACRESKGRCAAGSGRWTAKEGAGLGVRGAAQVVDRDEEGGVQYISHTGITREIRCISRALLFLIIQIIV